MRDRRKEAEDPDKLMEEYKQTGSLDLRNQLVMHYSYIAKSVAIEMSNMYHKYAAVEEMVNQGILAIIDSLDRFDPGHGVKFSTYAVPMISGEIKRFLRDDGMIKVSRSLKELAYKAYLCQERLQEKWGRDPTVSEIAEELGVEREELSQALDASGDIESLHKPIYQKEGQEIRLMDKLQKTEGEEEQILNHMLLKQLLAYLNKEERRLIYLRYFANQTQTQVGAALGISQVQVSRMEKKILKKARDF